MFKPEVEDIGINIGFGQPHAQQNPGGERPDDIDPAFGIPVMLPGAALSTRCIPIGARHVMGKTTLVDIDNGPGIALISINLFPKPPFPETPAARPGLLSGASGLFYMSRPVCQAPAIWPSVSHQTAQRDRIGRRRDGLSPPAQASPGRSFGPSDARGAWEQSAWPNA